MPQPTFPAVTAQVTGFEYAGDIDALGGTQLTMLLEGFLQYSPPTLEDLFPTKYIESRTIQFEQYIDSVGIGPLVEMGRIANTQLSRTRRVRKKMAQPAFTREDIFVEDSAVNDLRKAGTLNDRVNPAEFIAERVQDAYMRRNTLITYMRYQSLLGGIKYTDARTEVSIDVSTGIPKHNFFRYDGWNAAVAANTAIPGTYDGNSYTTAKALTPAKGRLEALLFTDVQYRVGVPWTNKQADVAATIRRLKTWLSEVNRNDGWEIYMGSALYSALHENELIKKQTGHTSFIGNVDLTSPGGRQVVTSDYTAGVNSYTFASGELQAIAGCKINVVRGRHTHPETGVSTQYWPQHKVVLVAPRSMQNSADTIGMTWHCLGEKVGVVGPWIDSADSRPPNLPGVAIMTGDSFLPIVKYPHWISVLDVCEPSDLTNGLFDDALFDTGVVYNLY